jgi:3-deoxy-D-manno-octulosonic-acid transferase
MDFDLKKRLLPRISISETNKKRIWVHCASVGEFNTARPVLRRLKENYHIFLTYFSPRAKTYLERQREHYDLLHPLPLDIPPLIKKVERAVKPEVIIIVEKELWPSFVLSTETPKILINARFGGSLIEKLLIPKIDLIIARTEKDAEAFRQIGAGEVRVCGNMKLIQEAKKAKGVDLENRGKVVVAGSTHEGEERMILESLFELIKKGNIRLVLAPRHISRAKEVLSLVEEMGLKGSLRTERREDWEVLVLDTLGELRDFYAGGSVAIVGGTFVEVGGHNLLEPAFLGKPVIFGPHTFKVKDLEEIVIKEGLGFRAENVQTIRKLIGELIKRDGFSNKGLLRRSEEVMGCYMENILSYLEKGG